MSTQYQKDGKIFEITPTDEVNQRNEFPVLCQCDRLCAPGEAEAHGGNSKTGELWGWICKHCSDESEARYQASCFDVDLRESELAEMEY